MDSLKIKKGVRVVVAMSGGVDSSVTAAWLKNEGFDVIGISLQLHDMSENTPNKFGTCCAITDIADARRVAEKIGIPFYVMDMEEEFKESVIKNFVQEYLKGRTPNPCVRCNEKIKFRKLMDWALDLGADYLATGHYADIQWNSLSQCHELHRSPNFLKDQSYFLFTIQEEDLSRCLFPVGNWDKTHVREWASRWGLSVAGKRESQEICFVQSQTYRTFVEEHSSADDRKTGKVIDTSGKVLGDHSGIHQFTVGQRKGLGIPLKEAQYVVALKANSGEVIVGSDAELYRDRCRVSHVNWINGFPDSRAVLEAKIRYRSKGGSVGIRRLSDTSIEVEFYEPQRAITPGQALVLYEGTRVVGGGWIETFEI